MPGEVESFSNVKIEDESESFLSFKTSDNSFASMFTTPHNERKKNQESNSSRRRKYFHDESAIGSFHPFFEQPPKFYVDNIVGLDCSTPILKKPLTPLKSIPLSRIKTITGVYPSVLIEEDHDDILFVPQKESKTLQKTPLFPSPNADVSLSSHLMEMDTYETPTLRTSPKTPTHFPNYLRSTLSSANKAINASTSFQTAEGSPAHCPKLKNPRKVNTAWTFANGVPVSKKMGLLESVLRKNLDETRITEHTEELAMDDDDICVIEKTVKKQPAKPGLIDLITREIDRNGTSQRSIRSRIMPIRSWLGERAVYSVDETGIQTLERVECPPVKSRKLWHAISKVKTISPI